MTLREYIEEIRIAIRDWRYYRNMRAQWRGDSNSRFTRWCIHCGTKQRMHYIPWNLSDPRTGRWFNTEKPNPCHIQH